MDEVRLEWVYGCVCNLRGLETLSIHSFRSGEHTISMSWIHPFLPDHRLAMIFEIHGGLGTSKGFAIKQAHKTDDPETNRFATDHHPSKEKMARVMAKVMERCNGTSTYSSRSIRNKNWVLAASKNRLSSKRRGFPLIFREFNDIERIERPYYPVSCNETP